MQEKIKGMYRWIGLGVGLIALVYFLNSALEDISSFPPLHWSLSTYASFTAATILSALVTLLGGYAWVLLLRSCGEAVMTLEALVVFTLAQLAKYIPGNVAHHAGRIALAGSRGFTLSRVIFTMILEAGWLIAAAAILAMVWLLFMRDNLFKYMQEMPTVFQLAVAAALAIAFPLLVGWVLLKWRPGPLRKILGDAAVNTPSPGALVNCLLLYVLCFLFMGIASDLLVRGLFAVKESRIFLLTGTFAVAWVAGFLTPGAPAGLGIREAILLEVLGPIYGPGVAVGLAVFLRAVTTLADGLTFTVALIVKGKMASCVPKVDPSKVKN